MNVTNELKFSFSRSSGPGGQNVNKVNSKVTLRWCIFDSQVVPYPVKNRFLVKYPNKITTNGEIVIISNRFRDQKKNKQDCINKLNELLQSVEKPPKKRKKTKPSKSSKLRRLSNKKKKSDQKKNRQSKNWD